MNSSAPHCSTSHAVSSNGNGVKRTWRRRYSDGRQRQLLQQRLVLARTSGGRGRRCAAGPAPRWPPARWPRRAAPGGARTRRRGPGRRGTAPASGAAPGSPWPAGSRRRRASRCGRGRPFSWNALGSSLPPPTCRTNGTPASARRAQTGSRSTWAAETLARGLGGQPDGRDAGVEGGVELLGGACRVVERQVADRQEPLVVGAEPGHGPVEGAGAAVADRRGRERGRSGPARRSGTRAGRRCRARRAPRSGHRGRAPREPTSPSVRR